MLHIDTETNPDVLREIVRHYERENDALVARIQLLMREIAQLKGKKAATVQQELEFLKELLARREKTLFGESSEKRPPAAAAKTDRAAAPQRGHGPKAQAQLPLVEHVHEVAEADRICGACGGHMDEMAGQYEEAEEITVIERRFVRVNHQRKKYRCKCNACIVTAPAPVKLVEGGRYSIEFAVEVATSKYLDHSPLERQCRTMGREGLDVDSQTLWDQVNFLARHLKPTYEAIGAYVLRQRLTHADETYWRLMSKAGSKRWWVWAAACWNAAFYRFLDSRSTDSAATLLGGYTGTAITDGYAVYTVLARGTENQPGFKLAHCWVHVRRKFVECEVNAPAECGAILALIGELYAVEGELPDWDPGAPQDAGEKVLEERRAIRDAKSRPIVARIHAWALEQRPLPRSGLGTAINYMLELWPGLVLFLEEPFVPLDNNAAERGLRGIVIGRKNHYGSRSKRGAEVAAIMYTLFESAKLCGIEPKAYVAAVARAAIANPGTVTLPMQFCPTGA
jgi:transposase